MSWALKEWQIAVETLLSGELILLIRKGGIREAGAVFEVPSDRPLLFPTYEHQQLAAIRPAYRPQFQPGTVPTVGSPLAVPGWAQITHQLQLPGPAIVPLLEPFHIWTQTWLTERLAWKPDRPAYALLLRVHRFVEPLTLPYQAHYRGCRSWIKLAVTEPWPASTPVLSTASYAARVAQIDAALQNSKSSSAGPE